MDHDYIFGDAIGVCQGFRSLQNQLGRINLFCKGDAPSVKETQEEKAYAEVASDKWRYYQDNFRPLEDAYMDDVNSLNTDGARDFASGAAASSTAAAFDEARQGTSQALTSAGINPASGRYQSAMSGLRDAEGMASTENRAMAKNSVDDSYVGGLQNISAIGRGQSTTTQAGLSDLASSASSKAASDAYGAFNKQAANINAVGSLAGAGIYAYGNNQQSSQSLGASRSGYTGQQYQSWLKSQ